MKWIDGQRHAHTELKPQIVYCFLMTVFWSQRLFQVSFFETVWSMHHDMVVVRDIGKLIWLVLVS